MTDISYDGTVPAEQVGRLLDASEAVELRYHAGEQEVPLPSAVGFDRLTAYTADPRVTAYEDGDAVAYVAALQIDVDEEELEELIEDLVDAARNMKGVLGGLGRLLDDVVDQLPDDLLDGIDTDGVFVYEGQVAADVADRYLQ